MKKYDVAIIGAGISGIMAAYRLIQRDKNLKIALIDQGNLLKNRKCPLLSHEVSHCINCNPCSIMNGFAGAGAFSDGKFIISTEYGGHLQEIIGDKLALQYMYEADKILAKYYGTQQEYSPNNILVDLCSTNNLHLKRGNVKHFGTENNLLIMQSMLNDISSNCTFLAHSPVTDVDPSERIIYINHEKIIKANHIIFAVGRSGNSFLSAWAKRNNISVHNNKIDIGIRVELNNHTWEKISSIAYDPKISYITQKYNDETRMFCFNDGGHVVIENTFGLKTVNGHAYSDKKLKSKNCNFALLSSIQLAEPFNDPTTYIKNIVSCSNIISNNSVIIQCFGDLVNGKRSTINSISASSVTPTLKAYPGDLSLCLPKRQLDNIIETIYQLEKIAPGTANDDTLLYGIEAKYYSSIPEMDNFKLKGFDYIYACGDGCGATRSLAQAAANGLYVADTIPL